MVKKRRKVTSKQVAERAGVSQTTVSFVLNRAKHSNISEETRQRVLQAAEELNYVPDMTARALARGRNNNIALVMTRPHRQIFLDEYIPNVLTGLNQVMQQHDFRIMVEVIKDGVHAPSHISSLIQGREVAGVILREPIYGDVQQMLDYATMGVPIISLDDWNSGINTVVVDHLDGVRRAVQHLINLGHRRIACISYAPFGDPHATWRLTSYHDTLIQAGIQPDRRLLRYGEFDPETGYAAMQALLDLDTPPTAVFGLNDVMAFGAMAAIRERGLRVPEDIAVVGYDGIRLAAFSNPPLTTIQAPDIERGRLAGEMLIDMINGKLLQESFVKLPTHLVVRESCGAVLQAYHKNKK
jgi:LacI family transcriptional regulator